MSGVTAAVNYATEPPRTSPSPPSSTPPSSSRRSNAPGTPQPCRRPPRQQPDDEADAGPELAERIALRQRLVVGTAARRARAAAGDDPGAAVRQLAVDQPGAGLARRPSGRPGRSTGPPRSTPGTAPRRWTPSSASASASPICGRSTRCSHSGGPDGLRRRRHGRTGRTSTWRSPPSSPCSSSPAATPRHGRATARAPPCARCCGSAPGRRRSCRSARTASSTGRGGEVAGRAARRRRPRLVRPGGTVPTDGVVVEGHSAVDTSLVTGEPVPVEVGPGAAVIGGTVNTSGLLLVRATRVGADTTLARIGRLVAQAQNGKAPVQRLADRVSAVFVPVVLALARSPRSRGSSLARDVATALTAAVAVLVIACPCALGLATPTALLVGTGRGAQLGILVRSPEVLESTPPGRRRAARQDRHRDRGADGGRGRRRRPRRGRTPRCCGRAAGVESGSEHPVARAIVAAARDPAGSRWPGRPASAHRGSRRRGRGGRPWRSVVGRRAWLVAGGLDVPRGAGRRGRADAGRGPDRRPRRLGGAGARRRSSVADRVKPTSAVAVAELRALGLRPVLLTGDAEPAARAVAAEVGHRAGRRGRRRAARGQGRRRSRRCRSGARRRHGRRRRQRRGRARRRGPRHRHGQRHGRRGGGLRPDARALGPALRRGRRSGSPGGRSRRSRPTCSGRSPTTWRRSRWRRPDG